MGYLIGGPDTSPVGGPSTWGRLRRAVGQYVGIHDYRLPTVEHHHNVEWDVTYYFTSAVSGGFVKGGYVIPALASQPFQLVFPYIQVDPSGPSPIDAVANSGMTFDENTLLTELTGEAVTGYGGTFAYTALMNTTLVYVGGGSWAGTPITAIGKLTQIT